jgi:hypothetical protein
VGSAPSGARDGIASRSIIAFSFTVTGPTLPSPIACPSCKAAPRSHYDTRQPVQPACHTCPDHRPCALLLHPSGLVEEAHDRHEQCNATQGRTQWVTPMTGRLVLVRNTSFAAFASSGVKCRWSTPATPSSSPFSMLCGKHNALLNGTFSCGAESCWYWPCAMQSLRKKVFTARPVRLLGLCGIIAKRLIRKMVIAVLVSSPWTAMHWSGARSRWPAAGQIGHQISAHGAHIRKMVCFMTVVSSSQPRSA